MRTSPSRALDRDAGLLVRGSVDALSDVLKAVRLDGAVYLNAEFTAPWCIVGKYGVASARERLAGGDHIVFFHYVLEGRASVRLVDRADVVDVRAGDIVLFPHDDRHLMGSDLHIAPVEVETLKAEVPPGDGDFIHLRHGAGGEVTRFVCGYLACNRSVLRPLLESLPRMMRVGMADASVSTMLRELFRTGVRETARVRPGTHSVLARLSELIFVEALRRYVEALPLDGKGWLAGVRDPHVGRALALLHGEAHRGWTVDALAREVALSRSALAERFTQLVGEPPIQYLMRWRLARAAEMLRSGREPIARVAERNGYESEAAFSRAFRREFNMPPGAWRKAPITP
jgi:AraC-like DNA-binding protein